MYELADALHEELDNHCTEEDFILKILQQSTMYASSEIIKIQSILEKLQDQREVERFKLKADSLMKTENTQMRFLFTGRSLMVSGMIR